MQETKNDPCNFQEGPVKEASRLRPFHVRMAKKIPNMLFIIKSRIKYYFSRKISSNPTSISERCSLNLQPGDWVEVLSVREIASTLDSNGKCKGLFFMPEMEQYCGKKFKIFKRAEKIKLESTGELRRLRSPSFFLEGVYCNGEFQGGCDRACFHFWREAWLKRATED